MYKLYGFSASNYYNMVKLPLLERDIEFDEVLVMLSDDESFLKISPRGMVPVLETEQGFISETAAILDYLEETHGRCFYPDTAFERAKVRELMRLIELYIELPVRQLYDEVLLKTPVSDEIKERSKTALTKGLAAFNRAAKFEPYLLGDRVTYADVYFMYTIDLAATCAQTVFDWDILADIPQAQALLERLNSSEAAQKVARDSDTIMEEFLAAYS